MSKRDNYDLDFKWMNLTEEDNRTIPEILAEMDIKSKAIVDAVAQLQKILGEIEQ